MKILFDHNFPVQIRRLLPLHEIVIAQEMGWDRFENGDLMRAGEAAGCEAMLTGDKNIFYQQNNLQRKIALVVTSRTDRIGLEANVQLLMAALDRVKVGGYESVAFPERRPKARK